MDKIVVVLIGAGVCCAVIGTALFIKLLSTKERSIEENGSKKLLDADYMENFKECFENTGDIEETLEQLSNIYTGNQYMYNLIIDAIDFIRDEQGDYETALDKINVDSDMEIMRMHNAAIKKSLNIESKADKKNADSITPKTEDYINEEFEEDEEVYEEVDDTFDEDNSNNNEGFKIM